jgi:aconitate hydratase
MTTAKNAFGARATLRTASGPVAVFRLDALARAGAPDVARLPYSLRVVLEAALRNVDGFAVTEEDVLALARWNAKDPGQAEVPFSPARVVLQDFTGVPCIVDLAAMRDAMRRLGGDPRKINPLVPVDLVIDHSVQVDAFGTPDALAHNVEVEFARNAERYRFLKWGQKAFRHFRAVPPATGIVHQVNLEYLARVVETRKVDGRLTAFPDSLVGTDSHTTMINGLGVVGWGVGGIEAEAVMLGQPLRMLTPRVTGVRLLGALTPGVTATDLVLTVTQVLRRKGVVDQFVEFFGPGLASMALPDRATVANMAPEYGATMGFFPVDEQTLAYLRLSGRPDGLVDLVERYTKEQGLFRTADAPDPVFTDVVEIDLSAIVPCMAGPKRPQDRVALTDVASEFEASLPKSTADRGFGLAPEALGRTATLVDGAREVGHGAVVIAAITSCTNTSNPSVLIAAGLLAKKAVERGLSAAPWVKTSLAPGSRVVTDYLDRAGLSEPLSRLGFHTVGYGCTTCIGNSGPLPETVSRGIASSGIVAAAVISGNRNFEGRVHPEVKANYLASPPLVVAYAIAGTVERDLTRQPLGVGRDGKPVHLADVWPSPREIADAQAALTADLFRARYAKVFDGNDRWNALESPEGETYAWEADSTYVQSPPFFERLDATPRPMRPLRGAKALAVLGDSVTTDHISPAGHIPEDGPAGRYLVERGVGHADFNSFGARRGNDRVMTRGTFANIRLRNLLVPGTEGGVTEHLPTGEQVSIFEAAERYRASGTPLVVLAGKEYGTGSSRDWAAKGTLLLGVRAVIAESYERIHRSNLVGMGVLPLEYLPGESRATLGLSGRETFEVRGIEAGVEPRSTLVVVATDPAGAVKSFQVRARVDTPVEAEYLRHGGILPYVLRRLAGIEVPPLAAPKPPVKATKTAAAKAKKPATAGKGAATKARAKKAGRAKKGARKATRASAAGRRTTLRSSKGTKLYAVRTKSGTFKDIQTYRRAHAADLRKKSQAEKAAKAKRGGKRTRAARRPKKRR